MPRAVRREGPLTALATTEPALAIGDVMVHHVRLSVGGMTSFVGDAPRTFVPWSSVRDVSIAFPTTRWRHPAAADTIIGLVGAYFGATAIDGEETPTFPIRIATHGLEAHEWPGTVHHLVGYRRKDAAAASRLVDELIAHPDLRVLLAHPADLLGRISQILRS